MSSSKSDFVEHPIARNCEKETINPVGGTVRGSIPSWLNGELVRVGPGIQRFGRDEYKHLFDGMSVLHKFEIADGQASYQNRILQSDTYKKNKEANRIVVSGFGTLAHPDPCETLFGRLKADFKSLASIILTKGQGSSRSEEEMTDNCNVNLAYYGDQFLETIGGKTNIRDYVAVHTATAHPHILPDGIVINAGGNYRHAKGPHYCFIKIPPSYNKKETSYTGAKIIAEIPCRWTMHPSYFHSFGITDTGKLIFIEQPYCMNLLGMATATFLNRPFCQWIQWYKKEKTRFYIVSMEDGRIHPVVYETDQLFVFHHINAFEEDGQIVVDVAAYDDAEWVQHAVDGRECYSSSNPSARRYVLPLNVTNATPGENLVTLGYTSGEARLRKGGKTLVVDVTPHHLTQEFLDLPRINYKFNGRKYRYFYGLGRRSPVDLIMKCDTLTGSNITWVPPDDGRLSEPVFVSRPDTTPHSPEQEEDDGVILVMSTPSSQPKEVSLVILDAGDLAEIGRVDFKAVGTVTGTLHGLWSDPNQNVHMY